LAGFILDRQGCAAAAPAVLFLSHAAALPPRLFAGGQIPASRPLKRFPLAAPDARGNIHPYNRLPARGEPRSRWHPPCLCDRHRNIPIGREAGAAFPWRRHTYRPKAGNLHPLEICT
jgi:hypothetical protein